MSTVLPVSPGDIVLVYCSVNEPILREAWHLRRTLRMTPRMRADFDAIFERRHRGGKKRPCVVLDVDDDEVLIAAMATFEKRPVTNLTGLHQLFAVSVGRTPGHPFPQSAKLKVAPTWPPGRNEKATHYIISRPFRVDRDEVVSVWPGYHVPEEQLDEFEDVCEKAMQRLHGLTKEQLQLLYESYEERTTLAWKTKMRFDEAQRKMAKAFSLRGPAPTNLAFVDAIWEEDNRRAEQPKTVSALVSAAGSGKEIKQALPTKSAAQPRETATPVAKQPAVSGDRDVDSLADALESTHIAAPVPADLPSREESKGSPAAPRVKISIPLKEKLVKPEAPLASVKLPLFPSQSDEDKKIAGTVYAALGEAIRKGLENPSFARIKSARSICRATEAQEKTFKQTETVSEGRVREGRVA